MTISNPTKISVVGLGKLGAPLAAVLARAGHEVIGVDLHSSTVDKVNSGHAPVEEKGLQACMDASCGRLSSTKNCYEAVLETCVTFIIVPTPSADNHKFDNSYILDVIGDICRALKDKSDYHLVVISSTVMPGSMGGVIQPALEAASDRVVGKEQLGLCYNPEFIALGNVIENMLNPDFMLIGESDKRAGDLLQEIHHTVCGSNVIFHRMNYINAEITKLSVNTYVTTKISYANMLAEVCENLPGADVDVVTEAVGSDSRIGKKYLKGAIGYGGPCFPRDNKAFAAIGADLHIDCALAIATDTINNRQLERLEKHIKAHSVPGAKICVLGLSYKPDTGEIDESQGVDLCLRLADQGYIVSAHDPMAGSRAKRLLQGKVNIHEDHREALSGIELAIIMTPWSLYKTTPQEMRALCETTAVLIDPWRMVDQLSDGDFPKLVELGKCGSHSP